MKLKMMWWVIPILCIPLFAHLIRYFGYDDPFITYRYSQNFANGLGLTYNGQPEFSTTTPLWMLWLAALGKIGVSIPTASNLLGVISLVALSIVVAQLLPTEASDLIKTLCALAVLFCTGLSTTLGSEIPFYLLCIAATVLALQHKRFDLAGLGAGLTTLTRPDGVLLIGVAFAFAWLHYGPKPAARLAILAVVPVLPWLLFLHAQTGLWAPTTLATKQAQATLESGALAGDGLWMVFKDLRAQFHAFLLVLVTLGGVGLWNMRKSLSIALVFYALVFVAAYLYMKVSWYHWYAGPLFPAIIVCVFWGLVSVSSWLEKVRFIRKPFHSLPKAFTSLVGACMVLLSFLAWRRIEAPDGRSVLYQRVGNWLQKNTPAKASVGMLEVGIIGYYSQRRIIDFAGILQPRIIRTGDSDYGDWIHRAINLYHPEFVLSIAKGSLAAPGKMSGYRLIWNDKESSFGSVWVYKRTTLASAPTFSR